MKTTRVLLSLNMKRLRESAGLDQDDLAEAAGLSKGMVAQLEQARKAPSPETLDKIAFGLGVSQAELLKDSDAFEQPAETVAQMTPAQLEAIVARASRTNDAIDLQAERARREQDPIPLGLRENWSGAPPEIKAVCLFLISGEADLEPLLLSLSEKKRKALLTAVRALSLIPPKE